jgi:hypothetical protein
MPDVVSLTLSVGVVEKGTDGMGTWGTTRDAHDVEPIVPKWQRPLSKDKVKPVYKL